MKEYKAVYKCRFCGKYYIEKSQNERSLPGNPRVTGWHDCREGYRAASDFITYILMDDDEKLENKLIYGSDYSNLIINSDMDEICYQGHGII